MAVVLEFRLLGPLEVLRDGRPLDLGGPRQKALLAALILRDGHVVSSDRLIDELWGEEPPATAPGVIQSYVSRLRRVLESDARDEPVIVSQRAGYALRQADSRLDLREFERLRSAAHEATDRGDPAATGELCRQALGLFRGPPLADFRYENFAAADIERLDELRVATLEDRIEADLACGRHAELVGELRAVILEYPFRERLRGALIVALYRSGRQAEALEAYRATRDALAEELGIDPSPVLQRLEVAILNQDPEIDWTPTGRPGQPHAVPVPAPVTLGPAEAPQPHIPEPDGPLIGREREVTELTAMFQRGVRCVTVTGPGGTGKTRLALEVARHERGRHPDGTWWVDLSTANDPATVPAVIVQALGVAGGSRADDLARAVGDWDAFLVIDNFEHVVEAAPVVGALLSAAPRLRILATSRVPLHVVAEHEYPVGPLDTGQPEVRLDPDNLPPAVALFVERATAAGPGFALTAANADDVWRICTAVDGLPLGIEVIAARTKLLTPREIVAQLPSGLTRVSGPRDLPDRQRTLRATFDWSYRLLDPASQRVLRCVSAFVGGFTLEAASTVAAMSTEDVTDSLAALLDASLIGRVELEDASTRFTILETIREFAADACLAAGERDTVRDRHFDWSVALVERLRSAPRGPDRRPWFRRLSIEVPNLQAALDHVIERHSGAQIVRLASGSERVFWHCGRWDVSRRALEAALEDGDLLGDRDRALALSDLGFVLEGDDSSAGMALLIEAIALWRRIGDERELARALVRSTRVGIYAAGTSADDLHRRGSEAIELASRVGDESIAAAGYDALGGLAVEQGDLDAALQSFEQSADAWRRSQTPETVAAALDNVGWASVLAGDLTRAVSACLEAIALADQHDMPRIEAITRHTLGMAYLLAGNAADAGRELQLSLVGANRLGEEPCVALCLDGLATVAAVLGQVREAATLAGAAHLESTRGLEADLGARPLYLPLLESARRELGEEAWSTAVAEGAVLARREAIELALTVVPG